MMRLRFIILSAFFVSVAVSQETAVHGTITYIAGDAVYTSLGRTVGVRDSAMIVVVSKSDTIASLKVFAVSSGSSVCSIISSKRNLKIGDSVATMVMAPARRLSESKGADSARTSPSEVRSAETTTGILQPSTSWITLRGRIGVQYSRLVRSSLGTTSTQPGFSINLIGKVIDSPWGFSLQGTLRGYTIGREAFFNANTVNQTRIYRLSIDFNDSTQQFSVGRIVPTYASGVGYIDGALVARKIGEVTLGLAAGYEPDFSQRTIITNVRKFALFGNYSSQSAWRMSISAAYARSYDKQLLNREVVSGNAALFPSNAFFLTMTSEIDLRSRIDGAFVLHPSLTSLMANINYRPFSEFSLGMGLETWRPVYLMNSIEFIPDSLLDRTSRFSPTFSVNITPGYGITIYESYSPRSTGGSWGSEYSEYGSIGISNILSYGINLRATQSASASAFTSVRGFGGGIGKTFSAGELMLRYQQYQYTFGALTEKLRNETLALDGSFSFSQHLFLWGTVERLIGLGADGYSFTGELSWRF